MGQILQGPGKSSNERIVFRSKCIARACISQDRASALADQVRRASKSICANIAEGFGRQRRSKAEFKRFLLMAIGSADEMQVWIRYALDLGYSIADMASTGAMNIDQIARMLQGLYSGLGGPDH